MPASPHNTPIAPQVRERASSAYLEGLHVVLQKCTGVSFENANRLYHYALRYGGTAEPIASRDGEQYGLHRAHKANFSVVTLFPSDAAIHPHFAKLVNHSNFQEKECTIYLPSKPMQPVWRGILLFHELLHEEALRINLFRDTDGKQTSDQQWEEEFHVYRQEIALAEELFGKRFSDLIIKGAAAIKTHLKARNQAKSHVVAAQFEPECGAPESKFETTILTAVVTLAQFYRAFDSLNPPDDWSEHIRFTKKMCQEALQEV